ncbi:zinc finger protein with KRAB and SCAN domains 8-like isoform X1 [Chanodichthys erythropterus]|uniref:zinc finger protein with KRAB and SCAN domains 8-like isoform X1 n=1 Tax=Chanodichthys erythropterus TaxID=933992 RepID=UPI00351F1284
MGLESIYSLMIKRMMAVADEIFDSVKDSIIEYEEEIERLKQENCCLRSRKCSCAETRHDTKRDGGLQGPTGSELSEIQVKLEVATVMCHEPLSQASSSISPLSEAVTGQEPHQCLSLLPEVMLKNEDIDDTDTQSSITVKSELCDNQASESNSSAVQSGSDCHVELKLTEEDPLSLQLELETFEEVLQKARRKHQNALCRICGKSFRNNGRLQNHMVVHQNERPFCCGSCGSRFKTKSSLKEHERLHTEGQAEDRSVEPLDSQLSHVEIILQPDSVNVDTNPQHSTKLSLSDQSPGKFHKICDRPFKRHQSMKNYMHLSESDRKYPCAVCGRRFYKRCHLIEHLRIHTGEKPFGCNKCGKCFVQWNQVKAHIIKHHEGDMSQISKKKA